ncbi:complex I subunit 5 family protein [Haloarcula nitratireducens]|nr:proton-conducting transporter membrane subunit [Halomicroarcula nitratireducens]
MPPHIVVAPMLVALGTILAVLGLRSARTAQRAVSVLGGAVYAAVVGLLTWRVMLSPAEPTPLVYQIGGWPAPFGITLVADALAVFMLVIAAVVTLTAVAFSVRFIDRQNQQVFYHPLFHCLLLGVTGAFLTGDLFNLFVWFEVMLMASYVFVAFYGEAPHTAAAFRYLVLNVIGSAVMLLAIGGLYATTGTLNMADMSRRLAAPAAYGIDVAPVVGLSALLFVTFALKAGLVPFQFWVPAAYRSAPLPIAAMLAGVTKKVGVYAIVRLYFVVFAGASLPTEFGPISGQSPLAFLAPVLFAMGAASIVVGGFGAIGQSRLDGVFAYSSVGQVGFIVLPVSFAAAAQSASFRRLALAAALVYALHHALTKSLLFLSTAAIRGAAGTTNISRLGGLAAFSPALGGIFLIGCVSIIGVPPMTGFFGKFLVFEAAAARYAAAPGLVPAVAVVTLLAGALFTILYASRAWVRGFWGEQTEVVATATLDRGQLSILAALALIVVAVGVGFDPVYRFAGAAAEAALDRGAYVDAVAPRGGGSQ